MKSTIFTLFSVLVLGHGVHAQAEGLFAKAFHSKLNRAAAEEAQLSDIGPTVNLSKLDEAEELGMIEGTDASLTSIGSHHGCEQQCDTGCNVGGCGWMCPGTGALGGNRRFAGTVAMNQDAFWGFYGTALGAYAINERVDVTFYSTLWTSPALQSSTSGLEIDDPFEPFGAWTEFGAGLNFKRMGGALNINPQIGMVNGSLLSRSVFGVAENEPRVWDGIVPSLTVNYDDGATEFENYLAYYGATRGVSQQDRIDLFHWWVNGGVRPWAGECGWRSLVSTGLHYELLRETRQFNTNIYSWLGPYVQVALPNGLTMRYAAGWNMDNRQVLGRDFYKVNIGYNF